MEAKQCCSSDLSTFIGAMSIAEKPAKSLQKKSSDLKIVFFDVQSTGFSGSAEVIQLAARYEDRAYSDYVMPKCEIPDEVADLTGLFVLKGQMLDSYNKCQPVPAVSKELAVKNFLAFLKSIGENILLVAHNCICYDAPMLAGLMYEVDKISDFKKMVFGFTEVISLFRKKLKDPNHKKIELKLPKLAEVFLRQKNETRNSVVHVKWLQRLINHPRIKISEAELIDNYKSAEDIINDATERKWKSALRKDLEILKVPVSDKHEFVGLEHETIERFVEQGIGLHDLYSYWKHGGEDYVRMIISTPIVDEKGQPGAVIAETEEEVEKIMDNLAVVFKHGIVSILAVANIARDHPFVTERL